MKKLRILKRIMKETQADRIWGGFLVFFFICSVVIWLREPEIEKLGDGIWYCYTVITTIGFGDIVVHTHLSRVLSMILSAYAVLVIAIITGVVVNYYNQIVSMRQKDTDSLAGLMEELEHLPELSREELSAISERIRKRKEL